MSFSVPTFDLHDGTKIPTLAWGNGTGDAKKTAVESGKIKETGQSISNTAVPRAEIYVTSKRYFLSTVSQKEGNPDNEPIPVADAKKAVQSTIQRLGFHPNLLLIHNPFLAPKGEMLAFWRVLEEMKDNGELESSIGVSNFRPQDFEGFLDQVKYKPVVNQLEYHPYLLEQLEPLLKIQEKHGIRTEAYGPLTPLLRHPTGGPIKPILERIAKRISSETGKDVDTAGALLLWTRAKGVVAVTASGNEGRIKKLAEVQTLPELKPEEVEEIDTAGRKLHFRAYDEHMRDFAVPNLPSQ
ncbi:BZ3500_MvSof-1268-A1-R1_Chr9g10601 [Microbotryum saponariae]|uniref:BZ3500_MvSof-1268-A1-R1_Chr9g10601 protein n=1 Tax=Microbotryum saponariae TaxID=289078 RepID=A0A2X0L4I7_9BASI|nr:BZ3501_MvSof-1269-A2-R1_Chr9g10349 [Microbotryum saponariae]SDA00369.1 BZ3500_MvSof-1268-A1-R1_Chr9g10601 [Microbotryum saponariae]